MLNDNHC